MLLYRGILIFFFFLSRVFPSNVYIQSTICAAGEGIVGDTAILGESSCELYKNGYCYACPAKDCGVNITGDDFKCSCDCDGVTKDCVKKIAPAPIAEKVESSKEQLEKSKTELEASKEQLEKAREELEKSKAEFGM